MAENKGDHHQHSPHLENEDANDNHDNEEEEEQSDADANDLSGLQGFTSTKCLDVHKKDQNVNIDIELFRPKNARVPMRMLRVPNKNLTTCKGPAPPK